MHAAAVLRLTGTERAVAEVAAVAEHTASLTAAASALGLPPDVPARAGADAPLVPLLDEHSAPDAATLLREIREWSAPALSLAYVPAFWRALAHQPRLLEATWRKDRLLLGAGALDEFTKLCAALAVAQFRQSSYWIPYMTQMLRSRGVNDRELVEIAGAVMHYVSFNTIAHAMRLESPVSGITAADVAPGGHLEHIVPGLRKRVAAGTQSSA
ncbi:MAG: carboxymuconolactone decarboxylase family protein [Acidobacteria bacterium]|nr:carboxymuconolactone decarboxylase family protein [Acidobacteriota bacterium]